MLCHFGILHALSRLAPPESMGCPNGSAAATITERMTLLSASHRSLGIPSRSERGQSCTDKVLAWHIAGEKHFCGSHHSIDASEIIPNKTAGSRSMQHADCFLNERPVHTPSPFSQGISELKIPLLAGSPELSPRGPRSHPSCFPWSNLSPNNPPITSSRSFSSRIQKLGLLDSMHPCMSHLADPFLDTSHKRGRGEPLSAAA